MITYTMQYKRYDTDGYSWWNDVQNLAVPFTIGFTLDESLDSGRLNLSLLDYEMELHPFTLVKIIQHDDVKNTDVEMYFFTGTRSRVQKRMGTPVVYDYEIELLELTKILERTYLETITFTQPLYYIRYGEAATPQVTVLPQNESAPPYTYLWHTYMGETKKLTYDWAWFENPVPEIGEITPSWQPPSTMLYTGEEVYFRPFSLIMPDISQGQYFLYNVVNDDARQVSINEPIYPSVTDLKTGETIDNVQSFIPVLDEGEQSRRYKVVYKKGTLRRWVAIDSGGGIPYCNFDVSVEFEVSKEKGEIPEFSVAEAIKRTCDIAYNKRCNSVGDVINKMPFTIDPNVLEEYKHIKSPEFTFTNNTLFEALLKIGTFIHAIPRLVYKNDEFVLTFDKLGDIGEIFKGDLESKEIGNQSTYNAEDYASDLIMPSQQLISTLKNGSIKDISGAYKTVRTEDGAVEISADTCVIKTQFPIYLLNKVEMAPVNIKGEWVSVGDITKYLYESAEYKMLAVDGSATYPYSKAYALEWSQGSNTIRGFNFQAETLLNVAQAFKNPAIINILQNVTGKTITDLNSLNYTQFAFRVTYIPIFNARLGQRRFRKDSYGFRNDMVYNQASNIAESEYMSKNIRAASDRMGNEIIQKTYLFDGDFNALNYLGKRVEDYYISNISASFDKDHIQASFTYTKNFNRLNAYTSLNSELRMYEIDERRSEKREMLVEKTILFQASNTDIYLSPLGKKALSQFFPYTYGKEIGCVANSIYSNNERGEIARVVLPVNKLVYGNSMVFFWEYFDNYGAGFQSDPTRTKVNEKKSVQRLYPYTDSYGRIDYMKIYFKDTVWAYSNGDVQGQGQANLYPQYLSELPTHEDDVLKINKDSREKLTITYQVHYICEYDHLAIFDGIAKTNVLMSGYDGLNLIVGQPYDKNIDLTTGQVPSDATRGKIHICYTEENFNSIYTVGYREPQMTSILLKYLQIQVNSVSQDFDYLQLGSLNYVIDIESKKRYCRESDIGDSLDGHYFAALDWDTSEVHVDGQGHVQLWQLEYIIPDPSQPTIALLRWHPVSYDITKVTNLMAENHTTDIHGAFTEI